MNYKKGTTGALVASLVIVIILIIAGYYAVQMGKNKIAENEQAIIPVDDLTAMATQSDSTELEDIEADLDATNLDNLDAELNAAASEI